MGYVIDAVQVFSSVLVVQKLSLAANDFQRILLIKQFARFPKKYTYEQTYFVEDTLVRLVTLGKWNVNGQKNALPLEVEN